VSRPELSLPAGTPLTAAGVEVVIAIDREGAVSDVQLQQSLGAEADQAVLDAARALRFAPATRGGEPIAVRVKFRFTPHPAPPAAHGGMTVGEVALATAGAAAGAVAAAVSGAVGAAEMNAAWGGASLALAARAPGSTSAASGPASNGSGAAAWASGVAGPASTGGSGSAAKGAVTASAASADGGGAASGGGAGAAESSAGGAIGPQPMAAEGEPTTYGARGKVERPPPGATSRIKLTGGELREIPGTLGEPLRVVATLPGVARSPFGLGFFVVRGASFQNTGFFVDDYNVPLLYHLGAGPAIIASSLVSDLDFYPGGYPVSLGRYTAGVIELHTAPPPTDRFQLEFEIDALRASAVMVVPLPDDRGSVAVAFRRSYFELILPLITDAVNLSYTDYQLRVDYKVMHNVRASLFFFGSRDALETKQAAGATSGGEGTNTGLRYAFDQVIAALEWTPSSALRVKWSGTIGPSRIDLASDRAGADSLGTNTSALRLGERLEARLRPSPLFETRIGADLDVFLTHVFGQAPSIAELPNIPSAGPPTTSLTLTDDLTQLGVAPFIEQVVRPDPFEVTLGFRAEYLRYGDVAHWLPDPRAVVRLQIAKDAWLKAGSGFFSQPPLPFQVLHEAGNARLRPNRALQSSVGAEVKLPFSLEVDTNFFYNSMWQLTRATSDLVVGESGQVRPAFYADDGRGRAYGWELMLRRRVSKGLFGWLSYTLSRSERFLEGGRSVVFGFDQTHVLNLALSYAIGGFRFGARFQLATGRPVGDLLDPSGQGAIFDADANDLDPASRGARTRLPTFHQLDVRIDRDFTLGILKGSVYIDVLNVYNAQNGEAYQYEYDFSKRGKLPGIPFLPTLGVRGVLR
jgi:TonB family protein